MGDEKKIYTKFGDDGKTSLVNSVVVPKSSLRIDVYGTSDELNSWIGYTVACMKKDKIDKNIIDFLLFIQKKLFSFGSLLACAKEDWESYKLKPIDNNDIKIIEEKIDLLEQKNTKLANFILPGGSESACRMHVARTICRRLERKLITFYEIDKSEVCANLSMFINRLSDYLFVCARYINKCKNVEEEKWN